MAIVAHWGDATLMTSLSWWLSPGCQDCLTGSAATKVVSKTVQNGSQPYRQVWCPKLLTSAMSRHATEGEKKVKTTLSALLDDYPRDAITSSKHETEVHPGNGISAPVCQLLQNHLAESTSRDFSDHFSTILPIFCLPQKQCYCPKPAQDCKFFIFPW